MIRICFTIIAYIISFLSHSGETDLTDEYQFRNVNQDKTVQVIQCDSLRNEDELCLTDLK